MTIQEVPSYGVSERPPEGSPDDIFDLLPDFDSLMESMGERLYSALNAEVAAFCFDFKAFTRREELKAVSESVIEELAYTFFHALHVARERYISKYTVEVKVKKPLFKREHISPGVRFNVLKRDKYRCQICGKSGSELGVELHLDHRIPVAKGGTNDIQNLWTLCNKCNSGKSAKDL